ncbi:MAG TPA: phosphomethylpyrimidine synthase, partial [Verrucomicrobiae bacterium]|nr:phosphomethylpyrimidine synthase [Verrucomicrobiae bacterium]
MIAKPDFLEPHSSEQLPASKKIYVEGTIHPEVRVPMREIEVSPTKSYTGAITPNDPVRVYDCSGPWGDPAFTGTSEQGLPALRAKWIRERGDVEEIDGREVKPQDNGYLSGKHAEYASKAEKN